MIDERRIDPNDDWYNDEDDNYYDQMMIATEIGKKTVTTRPRHEDREYDDDDRDDHDDSDEHDVIDDDRDMMMTTIAVQ